MKRNHNPVTIEKVQILRTDILLIFAVRLIGNHSKQFLGFRYVHVK